MIEEDINIAERVILVSGATGNIGSELTTLLAANKCNIILMGRNIDKLTKLYDECAVHANQVHIMQFDLLYADPSNYERLHDTINNEYGKIDTFINLAGTWGKFAPISTYDIKTWYEVMQTNLNSTFMLIQTILPLLQKSNDPQIIFTTIDNVCKNYTGALKVANDALISLMNTIRSEYNNVMNLSISRIDPYPIDSKLYRKNFPGVEVPKLKAVDIANEIFSNLSMHQRATSQALLF